MTTVEALRDVLQWTSVPLPRRGNEPYPTRWRPADFKPSIGRSEVQRRVSLRGLPKWRRPEREELGVGQWGGRWSLVHSPGTLGAAHGEQDGAEKIAHQWLLRYGIVSRDWYKKERPNVEWRAIYHELKRLEFRGDVRRGYFVAGLAGAQFALPEAVEMLRSSDVEGDEGFVVMAASDPANVYALPLGPGVPADPVERPRGARAQLVTQGGRIVLSAGQRSGRLRTGEGVLEGQVRGAAEALARRMMERWGGGRRRDVLVESIDGERAGVSRWAQALLDAGYRRAGTDLRYYAGV